jgi:hypothetical protein
MSGLDFHVKVWHPLAEGEVVGEGRCSVKQYKMCGCVTVADLMKTIKQDFALPNVYAVLFNNIQVMERQYLDEFMPYRGGVLEAYYV